MFSIKKMRERKGLTQQEVANVLEVKKARYGDWERETTMVNLRDAIRLADLFDCTLDELAGREWPRGDANPYHAELAAAYDRASAEGRRAILTVARSVAETSGGEAERDDAGEVSA